MHELAQTTPRSATARETPEMARSNIVLTAGPSWLSQLRDAIATPTVAGISAALFAGWQDTWHTMPVEVFGMLLVGTLLAVEDQWFGWRRAREEGKASVAAFVTKTGNKLASRVGYVTLAAGIGIKADRFWDSVGAMVFVLMGFEALSVLGHIRFFRRDSAAETALVDRLAALFKLDGAVAWLIETLGGFGDALKSAKAPTPSDATPARRPAPNGGP